ncbi:MAG: NAD(P)H-hydrate dehydratase, partial [Melioribacteraceae bacterium]|nr:NAD(P)H-hydrate dehydratase [Melioribacteraceae bacterium]
QNLIILKKIVGSYRKSSLKFYKSLVDLSHISKCDVIVDAILGTGSSGVLAEPINKIVKKINSFNSLKIAIDIPTGLNINNSTGSNIYNANLTVTLAALKTGLFYSKGKLYSGNVHKGSIGIGNKYFDELSTNEFLVEPEDAVDSLPIKSDDINKYTAGKVLAISGSGNLPGAAIFSMNASMMSGTGAGILAIPKSIKQLAQAQMNSAVIFDYDDQDKGFLSFSNLDVLSPKIEWADVISIGPGLGRNLETKNAVITILEKYKDKTFVIDADAINALKNKGYKKLDLRDNILTPHHKEFADLIGITVEELENNLLKYGRSFAEETGAYLVLKGAPTIVFNPELEIFINTTGNSGLAKFGSGDVLTGIISAFVSQNVELEKAAIAAVYLHGLAADLILKKESEFGITPQKLIDRIPGTIKFLRKSIV